MEKKPASYIFSCVRILFGIIWLIDALFKWQSNFINNYLGFLTSAAQGQPPVVHIWFDFWIRIVSISPIFFAYATATVETLTALGLIFGFAKRIGYIFAAIFSFLIWSTAEGFGGPYTTGSTDVGAGIVYCLAFILLYLSTIYISDPFALDTLITRKLPWWKKLS